MYRLKGYKLSRFFGELEADVMEILWLRSPLTAKEVRFQLRLKKKLAETTVLTVLARLVEKGHLEKTSSATSSATTTPPSGGRSNLFTPTLDKDTFVVNHIKGILKGLQEEFPAELKEALKK